MNKKVSICIPTYEQPELLRRCLLSITIQKYKNFEVIITDDSRNNSVKDVVSEFRNIIPDIKYFKNDTKLGSPQNWNESINKASGYYIKIIHHDDSFEDENCLLEFVNTAENNPDASFLFSGIISYDAKNKKNILRIISSYKMNAIIKNPLLLLNGNLLGAPSVTFFKKELTESFDVNLKWLVDIDFYIQMLIKYNGLYIHKPLMKVMMDGPSQITNQCKNIDIELGEWLYIHKKFKKNKKYSVRESIFLLKMFYRYKVKSFSIINDKFTYLPNKKNIKILILINTIITYIK